jgi:hypothetical protein
MAGVPIRFRCFRCNQLLGVSRSKAGAVVACPKCSAELIVPDPAETEEPAAADASGAPDEPSSSWSVQSTSPAPEPPPSELDSGIPLDFLDIRPEDIRVEPGIRLPTPRTPAPSPRPVPAPTAGVQVEGYGIEIETEPPPPAQRPIERERAPTARQASAPTVVAAAPPVRAAEEPILGSIQLDAPTAARPRRTPVTVRPRDLVLPRSVVASWSLFVLLALALSFVAGLLAGHFVWRVH